MRVERSLQRKICVDGSLMKEFVLSEPVTPDLAEYLRNFGEVEILTLHGKQLLSFEKTGFITVKGVIGEESVEVRYAPGVYDLAPDVFHLFLYHYSNGKDVGKMREILAVMEGKIRGPGGC
ncbi:MAG TPA: hypothetical protein VMT31_08550 [Methanomicrobiales archaeon]|nr:hypothetical protein [Methanomicrobiales archaeon]